MASRFGYGNYRTLGECRTDHQLTAPVLHFTKGFKSLEVMRHAVFERRETLGAMMNSTTYVRAIRTVRRVRSYRGGQYTNRSRADILMIAYPEIAETHGVGYAREGIDEFLRCLSIREKFAKFGDRPFGVSFYKTGTRRLAHVLTYAHRRFYLWRFDGESTDSGSWAARCIITNLLHACEGRSRILIDRMAPRKNEVELQDFVNALPDYLRKRAEIVSCFRRSNIAKRIAAIRGKISARTAFKVADRDMIPTSPTWFIYAFMGHRVRGQMIRVRLEAPFLPPSQLEDIERNWFSGTPYRGYSPSVIISPESKYMIRLYAFNKVWTAYRPDSDRAQYVREYSSYRYDPAEGDRLHNLTRGAPNQMCRVNREDYAALLNSHTTLADFAISVETLARMEAQTGQ